MSISPRINAALALLLAISLSACGGGSGDQSSSGSSAASQPATTPAAGGAVTDQVTETEYKFDPAPVTAKQGATLSVTNDGKIQHDLKVRQSGKVLGGTPLLQAGQSGKLKVSFKPGTYEMFCSVPGHEELGMKGTFTVK